MRLSWSSNLTCSSLPGSPPPTPAGCSDSFCAALSSHTTSSLSHCPRATWAHVQKQQPRGVAICQTSKVQKFLQWTSLNLHSLDFDWHQMQAPSQNVGSWKLFGSLGDESASRTVLGRGYGYDLLLCLALWPLPGLLGGGSNRDLAGSSA